MTLASPHYLVAWGKQLTDTCDIEQHPTGPIGRKVARGATSGWAIPAYTKNPEAAWKVLKFLACTEAQLALLASGRGGASLPAYCRALGKRPRRAGLCRAWLDD